MLIGCHDDILHIFFHVQLEEKTEKKRQHYKTSIHRMFFTPCQLIIYDYHRIIASEKSIDIQCRWNWNKKRKKCMSWGEFELNVSYVNEIASS